MHKLKTYAQRKAGSKTMMKREEKKKKKREKRRGKEKHANFCFWHNRDSWLNGEIVWEKESKRQKRARKKRNEKSRISRKIASEKCVRGVNDQGNLSKCDIQRTRPEKSDNSIKLEKKRSEYLRNHTKKFMDFIWSIIFFNDFSRNLHSYRPYILLSLQKLEKFFPFLFPTLFCS